MNQAAPEAARRKRVFALVLFLIVLVVIAVILLAAEALCRRGAASPEEILAWTGGGRDYFMYDATLGWCGTPDAKGKHRSGAVISHNKLGYRDTEWDLGTDKQRVLLLGDSNMWGYGVEDDEYPAALLNSATPRIRWFNAGMNGYGTDQAYLSFLKLKPMVRPDLTILVVCANDRRENTSKRVRNYNKPYFLVEGGELILKNVPVPQSQEPKEHLTPLSVRVFRKTRSYLLYTLATRIEAMQDREVAQGKHVGAESADPTHLLIRKLSETADQKLLVAAISKDEALSAFCEQQAIPFLDLSTTAASQPGPNVYGTGPPKYGHWTPEGNRAAANSIRSAVLPLLAQKGAE